MNPTTFSSGVATLDKKNLGRIAQIIGPVLDVAFLPGKMPNIYNAMVVKGRDTVGQPINVTCEVQQLLGNNQVRAVAMSATDGLTRGMDVIDTGAPLSVPVGGATLGRIFNVLGEPIDNLGPVDNSTTFPIHRSVPAFLQLDTKLSIFENGIKVLDLLAPYRRGGKIRLFGGAGVGFRTIPEAVEQISIGTGLFPCSKLVLQSGIRALALDSARFPIQIIISLIVRSKSAKTLSFLS
ncbi:hypothetical protein E3N88_04374 [Mikania micrantha]|uniref:H(+)-transporting two-sector ATPase n=1 Tax=Mikania micrantha TaxID=192012 RepID=A0A5N6PW34_9ASTR|nr:hypothetical protein E3N88_04374 [Mikania micrantha]